MQESTLIHVVENEHSENETVKVKYVNASFQVATIDLLRFSLQNTRSDHDYGRFRYVCINIRLDRVIQTQFCVVPRT